MAIEACDGDGIQDRQRYEKECIVYTYYACGNRCMQHICVFGSTGSRSLRAAHIRQMHAYHVCSEYDYINEPLQTHTVSAAGERSERK